MNTIRKIVLTAAMTIALASTGAVASATEPTPDVGKAETTFKWFMPDYPADGPMPTAETATWPQDAFTGAPGQFGWCQIDTGESPAPDFGPTLEQGEDHGWVKSWYFEKCGTPPVVAEPTPAPVVPAPEIAAPGTPNPAPTTTNETTPAVNPAAPSDAPRRNLAATGAVTTGLVPPASVALVFGIVFIAYRASRRSHA